MKGDEKSTSNERPWPADNNVYRIRILRNLVHRAALVRPHVDVDSIAGLSNHGYQERMHRV